MPTEKYKQVLVLGMTADADFRARFQHRGAIFLELSELLNLDSRNDTLDRVQLIIGLIPFVSVEDRYNLNQLAEKRGIRCAFILSSQMLGEYLNSCLTQLESSGQLDYLEGVSPEDLYFIASRAPRGHQFNVKLATQLIRKDAVADPEFLHLDYAFIRRILVGLQNSRRRSQPAKILQFVRKEKNWEPTP